MIYYAAVFFDFSYADMLFFALPPLIAIP